MKRRFIIRENYEILSIIIQLLITKDFMKIYRKFTIKPYSFQIIDTTTTTDDPVHFKKYLLDSL